MSGGKLEESEEEADETIIDSDDEFRDHSDFLNDKLVFKADLKSKRLVLHYLKFILTNMSQHQLILIL